MRTYTIKKLSREPELFSGNPFSPDCLPAGFDEADEGKVDQYPWGGGYQPDTLFRIGWREEGLYVLMASKEETIQAKETRVSGRQCVDSCMEFFVMPMPESDPNYINFEVNPLGIPHIGYGPGRGGRTKWSEVPEGTKFTASAHENGWWAVAYFISVEFLKTKFPAFKTESGRTVKANLYKCDESVHPHFGTWNDVTAPQPDFHRPEYFTEMTLG